ncbi:hypothetical protein GH733_004029 [Mirounga leonina]|nr:hypothetical protein GH733_004029 [Mirounga leonina]
MTGGRNDREPGMPFHHGSHGGTVPALRYPITVGLNKEHKVTKNVSKPRHSCRHGHCTKCIKRTKFVQAMI